MRLMSRAGLRSSLGFALSVLIAGCGGSGGNAGGDKAGGLDSTNFDCDGSCANQNLSTDEVTRIVRQAVTGMRIIGRSGTVAVTDRVGNVLALYRMTGAPATTKLDAQVGAVGSPLEALPGVPATLAAISKAGTGAYLSSQGNGFSTRTASQIVQENFLANEKLKPGGPLFGVQFSQLICGDVTTLNPDLSEGAPSGSKPKFSGLIGPRPLPLGLSADPGGLPIYEQGDVVGGIGVEFDGVYRVDRNPFDTDDDPEERAALYGLIGFEPPSERIGDSIFVAGKSFRFTDLGFDDLEPLPAELDALDPAGFVSETFYSDGTVRNGATFGTVESGFAKTVRAGVPAMNIVGPNGAPRFPTRGGSPLGGAEFTPSEVDALLDSSLNTAFRMRAAIRNPRDTAVRVSIWVVDHLGNPLGFTRSEDAPVFGTDVSLQKARTALFFSSPDSHGALKAAAASGALEDYAGRFETFSGGTRFGEFAFSDRGIGNLARPFFPDGINGNENGPLSLPFPGTPGAERTWSPFNTGFQLDLIVANGLATPILTKSVPDNCADGRFFGNRFRNGSQIFAGAVPLYRNGQLIGAIGISGDGIDQDDTVAFYGASHLGLEFAGHGGVGDPELGFNAPFDIRADHIVFPRPNTGLRYVNCPEGPFSGSNDQNVCEGL